MAPNTLCTLCAQENSNAYELIDYTSDTSRKRYVLRVARAGNDDCAARVWLVESDKSTCTVTAPRQKSENTKDQCRGSVCAWAFKIVDTLGADRIIVSVFASALDRFLMLVQCCPEGFKLVALTGIFVAFKE